MSSFIFCPDCNRKLKVPETMVGKSFRCPACKAVVPPLSKSRSTASDPESDEPDERAPSRAVKKGPSPRSAAAPIRSRPRDEELDEDLELVDEEPIREKRPRKRRPSRKNSSTGLIIGLVAGGVVLLLMLGGGGWLLWHFLKSKAVLGADWQSFSPPGGDCTVLTPATPVSQTVNGLGGVSATQYSMERMNGREAFAIAVFEIPPQALRPSLLEDLANTYRKGVMDRLGGGEEMSKTSISLGKIPGLQFECKATARRGSLSGRVYLAKLGNRYRAYVLAVVGDSIQPNPDDIARFLDSFKITAPATAPDLTGAAGGGGPQLPPAFQPPQVNPPVNPLRPNPGPRPPRLPRPRI